MKKKRALASPFVMTLGLVACGKSAAQPTAASGDVPNPPMLDPVAAPDAAAQQPPVATASNPWADAPRFEDYPKTLNAKDAQDRIVYRSFGDAVKCFVDMPWPKGQPRAPGMMKTQDVPCPPSMQSDAWKQCPGGTIDSKKDGATDCACFTMGNPPPIPHKVTCP